MIVGKGDLAKVLKSIDRCDVNFFASGVSNSGEVSQDEFDREKDLLLEQKINVHLVYFSSLGVFFDNSPYLEHKRNMEYIVRQFRSYTIVRIGNITWGDNKHTLINYLKAHPEAKRKPVWRHLIDKEDFLYWVSLVPVGEKHEFNITGRRIWVPDLVFAQLVLNGKS